jgi:transcriptional regulator with PAS, ATPase and Fis domain
LIPIDCAALAQQLLESELCGYERGAFTGAVKSKPGLLEVADGGTLFLDEIGELLPDLQVKLLRVLQEHQVRRLGGTREISVDVRFVSATNRDLNELIAQNKFRSDLFYPLNVVSVHVPSLRERGNDILLLARYFLARFKSANNAGLEDSHPKSSKRSEPIPGPAIFANFRIRSSTHARWPTATSSL